MGAVSHDDVASLPLDILIDLVEIDQVAMVDPEEVMGQEFRFVCSHSTAGGVLLFVPGVEVGIRPVGLEVQDVADVQEEELFIHREDDFIGVGTVIC